MRYYLDTSVWRDYYENRSDGLRPLGDFAFDLLKRIKSEKDIVVYSELTIKELARDFDEETIKELFSILLGYDLLEKVEIRDEQIKEAKELSLKTGVHLSDCIHSIVARDNDAILIARDKHFEALRNIVEIRKPEDLL
jgi:predicted nucleic acid-binding protein